MKKTIHIIAIALPAFGIMAASCGASAGAAPSPFEPRNPNFDYSMCEVNGRTAPATKAPPSGTPITLTADQMCECVQYQVGAAAMEKIKCPGDISGVMPPT